LNIQDFRATPLSDNIIHALISATQAYTELDVLMAEYPDIRPLLSDMILALDVYYQHYDAQPDIVDICKVLFIPDETSMVGRSIATLKNCAAFAKRKIAKTEILTAGDILIIDAAINTADGEFPLPDMIPADCEQLIEQIWSSLYDL